MSPCSSSLSRASGNKEGFGTQLDRRRCRDIGLDCDQGASIPISLTGGKFASDKMVITYTNNSQFAHEINASNWYEILTIPGVAVGRSDPDADPSGYRTLMVWKLAQRYYNRTTLYDGLAQNAPDKYIRHQEVDLISSLKSGEIDYAWN